MRVSQFLFTILGLFIFCSSGLFAANHVQNPKIDKLIIFGDSLSDNGNFYELTNGAIPISPPYSEGRFSNNLMWVEYLANSLSLNPKNKMQFSNYAYAGTWAIDDIPPGALGLVGISFEIEEYLENESSHGIDSQNQLFIFWIGANDYLDGRIQESLESATDKTIAAIETNLETLLNDGAQHILILNLPDLGLAPSVTVSGKEMAERVSQLAFMHNRKLTKLVQRLQLRHPQTNIMSFDVTRHLNDVIANPEKYHFTNLTDPCYVGEYASLHEDPKEDSEKDNPKDFVCSTPDSYLYWDKTHPSSATHRYLAEFTHEFLKENFRT